MKVLRKGKPRNWTRNVTCRCGALLEVSMTDCKLVPDQRDGDYFECKCPECKSQVTIAASLVQ